MNTLKSKRSQRSLMVDSRCAMTLIESIVAIVVAGVMLVAALNTMAGAVQARQLRSKRGQAELLANGLMSEILLSFYEESNTKADQTITRLDGTKMTQLQPMGMQSPVFGPESGEGGGTRLNFDDVDDYNGWQSTPPETKDGTPLASYTGWKRTVSVQFADLATGAGAGTGTDTGMKLIEVEVFDSDGVSRAAATALRSKVSGFERPPTVTTDYVNWIGIELEATGSASAIGAGATSVNQTP